MILNSAPRVYIWLKVLVQSTVPMSITFSTVLHGTFYSEKDSQGSNINTYNSHEVKRYFWVAMPEILVFDQALQAAHFTAVGKGMRLMCLSEREQCWIAEVQAIHRISCCFTGFEMIKIFQIRANLEI